MKEQKMKEQIEEMANDIAKICPDLVENCCGEINCVTHLALSLYDADYRKQSEWISVDDRLPDREGTYLVYTWKGHILMCNCFDYFLNGNLQFDNYNVTHWMPLPQPPEMKGGAE